MTFAVAALIVAAILGLAALLSSPVADKYPACEVVMFVTMYASLIALVVGAILSVIGAVMGVR